MYVNIGASIKTISKYNSYNSWYLQKKQYLIIQILNNSNNLAQQSERMELNKGTHWHAAPSYVR